MEDLGVAIEELRGEFERTRHMIPGTGSMEYLPSARNVRPPEVAARVGSTSEAETLASLGRRVSRDPRDARATIPPRTRPHTEPGLGSVTLPGLSPDERRDVTMYQLSQQVREMRKQLEQNR